MSYSRNRAIVLAIIEGGMTQTEAAHHFGVSTRWVRTLYRRFERDGPEGLYPLSRRPHTQPAKTSAQVTDQILAVRERLVSEGLDAGPESILARLDPATAPSRTTVWRILTKSGAVIAQPHKRPRSSWHRFEAASPNECWQSDFTHVRLADTSDVEVISWLDDHSRYLLHISAYRAITTPIVISTFTAAQDAHGLPASTLTDNGMVYTTRLSGGRNGSYQPNAFETLLADLNITQKNGRPNHPTTQGKIERFHQTLKRWLNSQPAPTTLTELNTQLTVFQAIYNTQRPHRALNGRTPHAAYHATPKDGPTLTQTRNTWRIRYDLVHDNGTITIRYAGRLLHLGIGRSHKGQRVIALANGPEVLILHPKTAQIIAEYTLDPTRTYQKKTRTPPERSPETSPERSPGTPTPRT